MGNLKPLRPLACPKALSPRKFLSMFLFAYYFFYILRLLISPYLLICNLALYVPCTYFLNYPASLKSQAMCLVLYLSTSAPCYSCILPHALQTLFYTSTLTLSKG